MGQTPQEFRESHKDVSDANALISSLRDKSPMDAAEKIADDLSKATKDMTPEQKHKYFEELAKASQPNDHAKFKMENGQLHVSVQGVNIPFLDKLIPGHNSNLEQKIEELKSKFTGDNLGQKTAEALRDLNKQQQKPHD
jgi:hypothetical protein